MFDETARRDTAQQDTCGGVRWCTPRRYVTRHSSGLFTEKRPEVGISIMPQVFLAVKCYELLCGGSGSKAFASNVRRMLLPGVRIRRVPQAIP